MGFCLQAGRSHHHHVAFFLFALSYVLYQQKHALAIPTSIYGGINCSSLTRVLCIICMCYKLASSKNISLIDWLYWSLSLAWVLTLVVVLVAAFTHLLFVCLYYNTLFSSILAIARRYLSNLADISAGILLKYNYRQINISLKQIVNFWSTR
jgi:hypothetical protein